VWAERDRHLSGVRLVAAPPFVGAWFVPGVPDGIRAADSRVMVMPSRRLWMPHVRISQSGRVLATRRLFRIGRPGRPLALPRTLVAAVELTGREVLIGLVDSSYIPFDLRESGVHLPLSGS
jgi:hypothetical protein